MAELTHFSRKPGAGRGRLYCLLLVLAVCTGLAASASANGRFPRAQRLLLNPTDPEHLLLSGTFGLVVSRDRGQSWFHICEGAFADPDTTLDPLVAFTQDGTLFVGTQFDLRVSDSMGCRFDVMLGAGDSLLVPDYTFDVDQISVLALTSDIVDGEFLVTLESSADAVEWQPLGPPLIDRVPLTLDVAPSSAQRLYVTAFAPSEDVPGRVSRFKGVLLTSDDRGQSWQERDVPGTSLSVVPYIAAVHPTDADTLYVRLDSTTLDEQSLPLAQDVLLVSNDAGLSFRELIRKSGKLFAFALSPDAKTILVGFGVPDDASIGSVESELGLYRMDSIGASADAALGLSVEHLLAGIPVHCLTWAGDQLFTCFNRPEVGVEVRFGPPGFQQLEELESLLLLSDVDGPIACAPDTSAAICGSVWEKNCQGVLPCLASNAPGGDAAVPGLLDASVGASGNFGDAGGRLPEERPGSGSCSSCAVLRPVNHAAPGPWPWLFCLWFLVRRCGSVASGRS